MDIKTTWAEWSTKKKWAVGTLCYTTVGLAVVFAWLLWGDLAWTIKGRTVGTITTLMVKDYGISDRWYGILIVSIPSFTNIFLIPWISYKSDRHRGRWGRRIPYILWTTPIVVIALAGIGLSSWLGDILFDVLSRSSLAAGGAIADALSRMTPNNARLAVFAFFWLLLDLGTTLSVNIYGALANDVVPRAVIGRFQAIARTFSLGIAVLFNLFFIDKARSHAMLLMLCIAAVYGIGLTSMCLMVKEGGYPEPDREQDKSGGNLLKNTLCMLLNFGRQCFAIPYYRWLFAALLFATMASVPYNTYIMFYVESLEVPLKLYGRAQSICFGISFATTFIMGVLSDKFHPIRTSIISMSILFFVNIFGGLFCRTSAVFIVMVVVHGVVIMAFNTLSQSLAPRLFPRSLFAQFSSALALLTALATVFGAPLMGDLLERSNHSYHLIFYVEAVIEFIAVFCFAMVFIGFKKHGGDSDYKAPEPARDI